MASIISGGDLESGIILENDSMTVLDGGIATDTTVNRYGNLYVSSGGTADSTTVNDWGELYVSSGGTATDTTVNSGGYLRVSSGGTVDEIIENGGYVDVHNGANVTFVPNTFSGLILSKASATIHSGTTANSTTVDEDSWLEISNGGTANSTTAGNGGGVLVLSDGTANNTTLYFGGSMYISSGGTATDTTLDSWGSVYVYNGGTANNTTVNSSGYLYVSSGGTANSTTVNSSGYLWVSRGGLVKDTIVSDGGSMFLSSGGTATNITAYGSAYLNLTVTPDTYIQGALDGVAFEMKDGCLSGCTTQSGSITVSSGGTANSTTLSRATLYVSSGGTANSTTISSGGQLHVSSGGTANNTTVNSDGNLRVSSGGTANSTTVNSASFLLVSSGGMANNTIVKSGWIDICGGIANSTTVKSGGNLLVSSGGTATNIIASSGAYLGLTVASDTYIQGALDGVAFEMKDGCVSGYTIHSGYLIVSSGYTANSTTVGSRGEFIVNNGGTANNTTVNPGGSMCVYSSGTANSIILNGGGNLTVYSGGTANNTTVNSGWIEIYGGFTNSTTVGSRGEFIVNNGGTANSTIVNSGGYLEVSSGGTANSNILNAGGYLRVNNGGKITGQMTIADGAKVSAYSGSILDFDISELASGNEALLNNLSRVNGWSSANFTLTVSDSQANGTYKLASGASGFNKTISVVNTEGDKLGVLTVGETVSIGQNDYALNLEEGALTVTVEVPDLTPTNLVGTAEKVSWDDPAGIGAYVVELSTDEFGHVLAVETVSTAQDLYELPAGTYQWRVKDADGEDWAVGEAFASENEPGAAKVVRSNADENDDLFFATANGTWSRIYYARHVGSVGETWNGTGELVSASGKGRIQDIFFGSADPNVLCLTDSENGDAIFLDDVYTELPEELEANTARLLEIHEIRAGAGDDIVDMTSQQFEYIGDGIRLRGGDGNDVLWANKGDNTLFGDAGNDRIVGASGNDLIAGGIGDDRMHGGGGDDVFAFCENWGADTVEQLATGSVTLWFASGELANWDADSLTYTDGENCVQVKGVTAEQVTLKFGDDDSAQFTSLSDMGAFDAFTSRKIFEEATLA